MNLVTLITGLCLVYATALAGLFLLQRRLLYFPRQSYTPPQDLPGFERFTEIASISATGNRLISWHCPATGGKPTLVFFHGNGDYLNKSATYALPWVAAGFGFLVCEYRGYSGLAGEPTEQGLYADARAQIRNIIMRGAAESSPENNLVFYGHSLGTGVAVQMATEFRPKALMLLAPYQSVARMAQLRFPFFPARWLMQDRFDSAAKIGQVTCPVLVGHGDCDRVIPLAEGRALFALANEPKHFVLIEGAGHADEISRRPVRLVLNALEGKHRARVFDGKFLDAAKVWLAGI